MKPLLTVLLLFLIAVVLQSYLIYIDTDEELQLLLMPGLITFLSIVIWLVSKPQSGLKKAFKIISIVLIITYTFWFAFVQFAMALGRGWNH